MAGFVLLGTNAGASERSSVERMADRPRQTGCAASGAWTRDAFKAYASCQASIYGLEPVLAHAVMEIESGFDPQARGADGEVGLMQVMPATARMLGFRGSLDELSLPATNIALGVEYLALANKLAAGDLCTTVMKYRAGHNENRFSALSVRYCERARAILTREGLPVTGPLPVATFGFSALSGADASPAGESRICVRRILVPGPRYMRCADYRSAGRARRIRALRAQLFDG
ncbi:lytic transglycosylase domain-containing protein [Mesorhizobium sp. M4A.F.Ca.ET.022.05.2.1]|uniref:lytic transglycosylase domain-containing protein n=1 Tax=Mesorhizobium sp. M4A.F.Ca.ET.022.05.2.1 TaxID=2496653 RepID=UPI000FCCD484|nr:lytic transglycosylase domain-containing protein [Mesorhizobium sp. M4A.F.Ca.ET.022.05.2.1]